MKWIKHMSDSSNDEFLVELEDIFGLEGYARWWKLLEAIAAQMKEKNDCSAAYPLKKWQTFLRVKQKKLVTFLEHLEKKQKIYTESTGNILRIKCPKLLEIRDNHLRNLQATDKKVVLDTDKDTDKDKELKKSKSLPKNGSSKGRVLPLKKTPPKKPKTETTDTVKAERSWIESYEKAFGEKPSMSPSRDRSILKQLIKVHGLACVVERIPTHIAGRKMLTIGGFKIMFNDLGVTQRGGKIEAVEMDRKLDQLAQDRKKRIALGVEW